MSGQPASRPRSVTTRSMKHILSIVRTYDGVLELAPTSESEFPEISWGDYFFYYAPDGRIPHNRQPFATIVTKNYPEDVASRLNEAERWRLNIHVGPRLFAELIGRHPRETDISAVDYGTEDLFAPHPLYSAHGWVCVVNPGTMTLDRALEALHSAYLADRRRVQRRQSSDAHQPPPT